MANGPNNIRDPNLTRNTVQSRDDLSKKNPRNQESPLYVALTRLFSGPLSSYKEQSQIRYKRRDLDRFKFTSASGKSFKKKSYNPFDAIQSNIMANQSRAERYSDFDQMEFTPEIASALDIYADEMTTSNEFRPILGIECKNEEIKNILYTLYYKTLNLPQNLYSWCRTMCKFGDLFLYLDVDEELGIKSVLGLPSPEVEKLMGEDKTNANYIQFQWNTAGLTFENWQVAHFCIKGQDKYTPYGTSILEPARRIWRQLNLMEDAMMAYRIVRSPERRVFYIDTGNIAPADVEQYMQKIITQMKRNQIVDPTTGRVDLRYNPMSIDEDYYIPVRGQTSGTKIENLPGGQFTSAIEDVKYLRDKLFSALKIPQAYLARGEGQAEDKTMLAQKDMRFAKTIQRLQATLIDELQKIGMIHLYTLGFRNDDLIKFRIKLNNPSKLAEMQELEHFKAQLEIAGLAKEQGFSKRWIFEGIFKMDDREFLRIQRDLFYDASFTKSLEAAGNEAAESSGGATGTSAIGGEPSAETTPQSGETPAAGGEEKSAEAPPPPGEPGNPLLAAPARREDIFNVKPPYLTAGSKGKWYKPVAAPNYSGGSRSNSIKAMAGMRSNNAFKGTGLSTLAAGIANESKDFDVFEQDEQLLNDVQQKLDSMSKFLTKKKKVIGENKNES